MSRPSHGQEQPADPADPAAESAAGQPLTDEVREWVATQLALGESREALFKALRWAGWELPAAARLLRLTPAERGLFSEAEMPQASDCDAAVPTVHAEGSAASVDAGDKWVSVLRHEALPDLWVFGNLLSAAECDALMQAARPRLSRSLTVDTQTGGESLNGDRTSEGMFFTRGEDELVQRIERRIARLVNWPVQNGEGLQVLRYGPGAQYRPHHDYFDPAEPGTPLILARGGQRVGTLIMYLQAPEGGGATVFPDIRLKVAPVAGTAVFFSYPRPHPASLSLHGGQPVTAGEKWIATKWLRAREFI